LASSKNGTGFKGHLNSGTRLLGDATTQEKQWYYFSIFPDSQTSFKEVSSHIVKGKTFSV